MPFSRVSDAEHHVRLRSLTTHDRETLRAAVQTLLSYSGTGNGLLR